MEKITNQTIFLVGCGSSDCREPFSLGNHFLMMRKPCWDVIGSGISRYFSGVQWVLVLLLSRGTKSFLVAVP